MELAGCVVAGALQLVSPEGPSHSQEGGFDCVRLYCSASARGLLADLVVASDGLGEAAKDSEMEGIWDGSEEGVVVEFDEGEEFEVASVERSLLGCGAGGNCCVTGCLRSSVPISEMRSGGREQILKPDGTCWGKW